jgi:hypothetical protein
METLPTESRLLKLSTLPYRRFRFLHSTTRGIRLHGSRGMVHLCKIELRISGNCLEWREALGAKSAYSSLCPRARGHHVDGQRNSAPGPGFTRDINIKSHFYLLRFETSGKGRSRSGIFFSFSRRQRHESQDEGTIVDNP